MNVVLVNDRSDDLISLLVNIWERSVRETHLFLTEKEILRIKEYVPSAIKEVQTLFIAKDDNNSPIAFLGLEKDRLEMLFLDPTVRRKGLGRRLLTIAIDEYKIKRLTVNEQNPEAIGFYKHMGFKTYKREEHDEEGNAYPLLYMTL